MSTLTNDKNDSKIVNKRASDPFDKLIFEQGLRAKQVLLSDKKLDSLVVMLNNGMILKVALSTYPKLKKATQLQLNKWELIADGIGIRWNALDEDLSIKGLIKESALNEALNQLQNKYKSKLSII
jgi:hypothetical protein